MVDLSFAVHKLAKFSLKPSKVNFEGLVNLLRDIRYNNTLGLNYYGNINDAPVSGLLIQASIKTENQLMNFSGSSWKYCPDTCRITGSYIGYFIKVGQLTMAYILQYQFLNKVHKLSKMHLALQEWL